AEATEPRQRRMLTNPCPSRGLSPKDSWLDQGDRGSARWLLVGGLTVSPPRCRGPSPLWELVGNSLIPTRCATESGRRAVTDRGRTPRAQPLPMAEVSPRRDWIALRATLATLGLMASLSWPPSCSALNLETRSAPIETADGELAPAAERPPHGMPRHTL